MKTLILAATTLFSLSAFAAPKVSTITCLVKEDKVDVKVEFLVSNLGSSKAQLQQHPKAQDDLGAILVTPEMIGDHYSDLTHLNGQGGDLRVSADKIRLFGDGDGYTFVDLVLYKNTDYQKGYVRVYGSGNQWYQKISCTVSN